MQPRLFVTEQSSKTVSLPQHLENPPRKPKSCWTYTTSVLSPVPMNLRSTLTPHTTFVLAMASVSWSVTGRRNEKGGVARLTTAVCVLGAQNRVKRWLCLV